MEQPELRRDDPVVLERGERGWLQARKAQANEQPHGLVLEVVKTDDPDEHLVRVRLCWVGKPAKETDR